MAEDPARLAHVAGAAWESLRFAATRVGPARALGVLATVAVLGVSAWWLLRAPTASAPQVVLPPAAAVVAASADPGSDGAAPSMVVVHVAGAVHRPGVLWLPEGARVVDALAAAGGTVAGADPGAINLAALLADGEQIYVPLAGEPPPAWAGRTGGAGSGSGPPAPLDLNRATVADLEALPGVGPATAAAIVEHRERYGPFATVDDLRQVRGIGDAKLAALADLVRV